MRAIWTIALKDLRGLFKSPLFWVITGFCCVLWSFMFDATLKQFAQQMMFAGMRGGAEAGPNMHFGLVVRHIQMVNFIMILAVSSMTMRLFAEEKKQRTFDLLLTSPVTSTQIVAGKFLAGLLMAWALTAVSAIYPLTMRLFTEIQWGPFFAAYLGLALTVACYVGVGIFASALTESSVLAVIMSLIFSVGLWFVGAGSEIVESTIAQAVFEHLNMGTHFVGLLKGVVSTAGLVFYLSVFVFLAFLTQRAVEAARWR